jgi:hypothetical protein
MSFPRLLRKSSQPRLASRTSTDDQGRGSSSDDANKVPKPRRQASELVPIIPLPWRKKTPSANDRTGSPPPTYTLSGSPKVENPTPDVGMREMPPPMSLPATGPDALLANLPMVPRAETMPVSNPVPDPLSEAWNAVKDGPKVSNMSRGLNSVGASSVPSTHCSVFCSKLIFASRRRSCYSTRQRCAVYAPHYGSC